MYANNIDIVKVGSLRLFKAMIDQLNLVETINGNVQWDKDQCHLSPGELIASVIMAMFYGRRTLYNLDELFEDQDLELLFGRSDLKPKDFNDDCLGRALDRIAGSGFHTIFGTAAFMAKRIHGLSNRVCHADTTSFQVYGDYEAGDSWEPDAFAITRGYNKHGRFDLLQFKLGLATNEEGIPFYGEALSGNTDDKVWCKTFIELLPELRRFLDEDTILVIDSAAMTDCNLREATNGLRLISRLPETFSICGELEEEALRTGDWQPVDFSPDEKRNAEYRVQYFSREFKGGTHRFVVVESKPLEKAKSETIDRSVVREAETLSKCIAALAKERFTTSEAAETVWNERMKTIAPAYHAPAHEIAGCEKPVKRNHRGRPAKDEEPRTERVYTISARIGEADADKVAHAKALGKLFVLFSSAGDLTASEVLGYYKGRSCIESRFAFLKDPLIVGPIYLKLPERVEALSHIMLLALLVYSLFERKIRVGLQNEEPYHVGGSYKTRKPKGTTVMRSLEGLSILRIRGPNGIERQLPANVNVKAKRIVRLCGFDIDIYVNPPVRVT